MDLREYAAKIVHVLLAGVLKPNSAVAVLTMPPIRRRCHAEIDRLFVETGKHLASITANKMRHQRRTCSPAVLSGSRFAEYRTDFCRFHRRSIKRDFQQLA